MFRSTRARCVAGSVLLVAALSGLGPAPVRAHADLVSADPAPNGSVVEAPDVLRLTFSEPIDPDTVEIEVLDVHQRPVPGVGEARVTRERQLTAEVALPDLEPGVFTIVYEVLSRIDGHATAGSFAFLVDPTGAAPPPADSAQEASPSVDGLTVAARWVALAALLVAFGGLLLWWNAGRRELVARQAPSHPPWTFLGLTSLAGAAGIMAYLWLAARPISGPGGGLLPDPAGAFGWTPFAIAMRVAIVATLAAGAGCFLAARRSAGGRWPIGVGLLLAVALGGMSLAGHAASIGGAAFAMLDWAHLVGVSAWLGALPAAVILAERVDRDRRGALGAILRRHGPMALVAAPVVVLTGIANSPLVLGSGRDLVASEYGNLLVAKAVLVAIALGIGAVNHLALRGRGRAVTGLLVGVEVAVAALAVLAAATMVTIQPASARQPVLNAPPVTPAHFFEVLGPSRVHLAVSLPAPGTQAYRVTVQNAESGRPQPDVQKVFLVFTPPADAGIPSQRVELAEDPIGGLWIASGAYTPVVGTWDVDVVVRREGTLDESFAVALEVLDGGTPEPGPPPDSGVGVPPALGAAWRLLPPGLLAWLPALAALVGLALTWRIPASRVRAAVRSTVAAVFVLSVAVAGSRTLVEAANAPTDADLAGMPPLVGTDAERGRQVYLANCASCHGAELDGSGPVVTVPPAGSIVPFVGAASDQELSYRIAYGVAGTSMPAFAGTLTAEERGDLIGYLRTRAEDP
ncbi:MAG TPA: copper resistance protein CopC [Candidatus Limnocylindria bacterium]